MQQRLKTKFLNEFLARRCRHFDHSIYRGAYNIVIRMARLRYRARCRSGRANRHDRWRDLRDGGVVGRVAVAKPTIGAERRPINMGFIYMSPLPKTSLDAD